MLTLARTGRIDKLSAGLCKSEDFAAVKERMASFMAAGFLAICKRQQEAAGEVEEGQSIEDAWPSSPARAAGSAASTRCFSRARAREWSSTTWRRTAADSVAAEIAAAGGAAIRVRRFRHR